MTWHASFSQPEPFQLRNVGSNDWNEFIMHAEQITPDIAAVIDEHLPQRAGKKVLDFGCGIGRVALKLWQETGLPTHGCDINPDAIDYISKQLSEPSFHVSSYEPPLSYEDASFDLIFSISIWTHLPPKLQIPWLKEMHRILKPGGTALISVSSASSLPIRKKRLDLWEAYSEEDLEREGILFVEYRYLQKTPEAYPGVTTSYGSTLHDFDYIRQEWGKLFNSVEVRPKAIGNSQDLVILKK